MRKIVVELSEHQAQKILELVREQVQYRHCGVWIWKAMLVDLENSIEWNYEAFFQCSACHDDSLTSPVDVK